MAMEKIGKVASLALSTRSSNSPTNTILQTEYVRAAKLLLGCYRTGDANDPEVYVSAVVRVLSNYPIEIVQRVVDPVTGLPSKVKWLPTIPEILSACEEIAGVQRRTAEYDERSKRQFEERAAEDAAREIRPTKEDMLAKYGPNFGLKLTPEPGPDKAELNRRMMDYSRQNILREYQREGVNPVYFGGHVVSPSLLKTLGQWPK